MTEAGWDRLDRRDSAVGTYLQARRLAGQASEASIYDI